MPKPATLAPPDPTALIFTVRRHRVIFDADLAALYGVTTKALNSPIVLVLVVVLVLDFW